VWETIKEFGALAGDVFKSIEHVIHGAFTLNWNEVKKGLDQGLSVIQNAGNRLGGAFKKGYTEGMKDDKKEGTVADAGGAVVDGTIGDAAPGDALTPATGEAGGIAAAQSKPAKATEVKGAGGKKHTTVNIKIGSLINHHTMSVRNVTEGASKVKQLVTKALTSAVSDSQLIMDQ
jgi:hypothetical protein